MQSKAPPSPPQVRPVPQEVGSEVCVHSTRSWAGPGARGSSTGGGRCRMRLLVGTPAQETPVSGCARVTGPPRRPAGTEASRDAKSRSPGAQARARCGAGRMHGSTRDSAPRLRPSAPGPSGWGAGEQAGSRAEPRGLGRACAPGAVRAGRVAAVTATGLGADAEAGRRRGQGWSS